MANREVEALKGAIGARLGRGRESRTPAIPGGPIPMPIIRPSQGNGYQRDMPVKKDSINTAGPNLPITPAKQMGHRYPKQIPINKRLAGIKSRPDFPGAKGSGGYPGVKPASMSNDRERFSRGDNVYSGGIPNAGGGRPSSKARTPGGVFKKGGRPNADAIRRRLDRGGS